MATAAEQLQFIPGVNLSPSRFTADQLAAAEALIQAYIQEYAPTLSLDKGTTNYELLVRPAAVVYLTNLAQSQALLQTQSLKAIMETPELASSAAVDAILSNLGVTRRLGAVASGLVRINFSTSTSYQINRDITFAAAGGLLFSPAISYRLTPDPENDSDLLLYSTDTSETQFYSLIPVTAVQAGVEYQVSDLTEFTPSQEPPFFISAFAFGGFTGGEDDETNEALISRIPEALAAKNLVSRASISGTLKDVFPTIWDLAVQASNGPAMLRNANNLLSFKTGGYADIYVRSSQGVLRGIIEKVASLVEIDEGGGFATYSVNLTKDEFPGHYMVSRITELGTGALGSFQILSETKWRDMGAGGRWVNKVSTVNDAVYTAYQTNLVVYRADYDAAIGTTITDQFSQEMSVQVEVVYSPLIKEIQEFVNNESRRVVLADYLVKAVIPCFVDLGIIKVAGTENADGEVVRLAIYNYINSLKIGQSLRVDDLITVIRAVPEIRSVTMPVMMSGSIYVPDGTIVSVRSQSALTVPSLPLSMIVPETTAFFVELSDISVQLSVS